MKSKSGKTSRNRQRKTAYAAMANQGSRNQSAIDGPIVGRLETVTTETRTKYDEDGEIIRQYEVPVMPYQRVVHDDPPPNKKTK